jgi:hypothetical protein
MEGKYNSPSNIKDVQEFDLKEVQVSEGKGLDVVITYNTFKYIIEMKIWRRIKYHEDGVKQLYDYLDMHGLKHSYNNVFNATNSF